MLEAAARPGGAAGGMGGRCSVCLQGPKGFARPWDARADEMVSSVRCACGTASQGSLPCCEWSQHTVRTGSAAGVQAVQ